MYHRSESWLVVLHDGCVLSLMRPSRQSRPLPAELHILTHRDRPFQMSYLSLLTLTSANAAETGGRVHWNGYKFHNTAPQFPPNTYAVNDRLYKSEVRLEDRGGL
jgi:hypothetical protein